VSDIRSLHHTVEQLQERNNDIEQSLTGQATYIRNLNQIARVNTQAMANLSSAVKDFMIRSRDRFYEVSRDIMWPI
jgi:ABC-type transporter Mla subunit MlaD